MDEKLWTMLNTYDMVEKLAPVLESGSYIIRPEDGKIVPVVEGIAPLVEWVYVRPRPEIQCNLWNKIIFAHLDAFPVPCLSCWKVVVRPRTLEELFALLDLQENHTERYCKCGIETREYVPANYGGYFYCQSKDEAFEVYKEVRALVDELISPDIKITIKRYCTEFEHKYGNSRDMESRITEHDRTMTAVATAMFDLGDKPQRQPEYVRKHIFKYWLIHAHDRGDMTCLKYNGGEPMWEPSETYEGEVE